MNPARIGVYVCECGANVGAVVDCEAVARRVAGLPGVVVTRTCAYACSGPGQELIRSEIAEHGLNRIVIAGCSPRVHESTFGSALEAAGLNPHLLEMANIREQCSWVHEDRARATEKAAALSVAAVERVRHHQPLEKRFVPMRPETIVIGGGIAGLTAALELADAGYPVILVERAPRLGGNLARVDLTAPYLHSARDMVAEHVGRVQRHPGITVQLGAELLQLSGFVGNFSATVLDAHGERHTYEAGSVIVATGFREFDAARATHFGYGRLPNVMTSFEFEAKLAAGRVLTAAGRVPRYVAILHCVGSRSAEFHGYCSRVCCMTALKYGHEIKSAIPDAYVTDLYVDMHAFGKGCEDFYQRSSEIKTLFMMYGKGEHPEVLPAGPDDDCELLIRIDEKLSREVIEIPADIVILMVGMEARDDAADVARRVNISQDRDGWFVERHAKFDPVATTTDGVFIAGACSGPRGIPGSVDQARAAAARILARIARRKLEVAAELAVVDADRCCGCRVCGELCPYGAIEFDPATKRSQVVAASCKACGACAAGCPSGAIRAGGFTDEQVLSQVRGVLGWASNRS